MTKTANKPALKKGDVVYWVTVGDNEAGVAEYWVPQVRIESWGKRQGTAVYTNEERYALRRFYTDNAVMLRTKEEVEAYCAERGIARSEQTKARLLVITQDWIEEYSSKAKPEIVAKAQRELEAIKRPASFTIKYT